MAKLEFWYDVETTGLDMREGAAVVQIAGLIVEKGVVVDTFVSDINPYSYNRDVTIDAKALTINGYKEEDFSSMPTLEEAMIVLMDKLTKRYPKDKLTCFGYNNSTFDKYFIEDMFKDIGRTFNTYFHWKQIDVFEVVKGLQDMKVLPWSYNQKLGAIGELLEVEAEGDLHDALVDIKLTRGIYLKIQEMLNASS
jgi:DNA polymerase III epsilon subunit-like protein